VGKSRQTTGAILLGFWGLAVLGKRFCCSSWRTGCQIAFLARNLGITKYKAEQYLERIVIEVGGRGKKTAQFKDFTDEKRYVFTHSDETDGIRRPLFMLGIV
jgi:hypothetical protein